jgi:hypothetical protein
LETSVVHSKLTHYRNSVIVAVIGNQAAFHEGVRLHQAAYDGAQRLKLRWDELVSRVGRVVGFSGVGLRVFASICLLWAATSRAQTTPAPATVTGKSQMFGVRVRLETALNSKTAVEGMYVEARPEVKMHLADGVELETSSRLVGRVGVVKPSLAGTDSAISVIFDKVRLKGRREIPVKATILWIGAAPDLMNPSIVSAPADRTTPGVGVEAGGSLVPPSQGYSGSEITGFPHRNEDESAGKKGKLPPGVAVQMGAIGGVNFFSDMSSNNSGFFRSVKGNVSVPGGTVLAIALVLLPPVVHP